MTHQKKTHPHAAIMKSCADDMNLSVFIKAEKWEMALYPSFHPELHYFACLPKHKDAVLNMLNGGESEIKPSIGWIGAIKGDVKKWEPEFWYMCDDWESRIKPEKQKRWIGVFRNDNGYLRNTQSYESIEELKSSVYAPNGFAGWQFIQIEVGV